MPAESIEELEEEETKVRGKSHLHELEQDSRWLSPRPRAMPM